MITVKDIRDYCREHCACSFCRFYSADQYHTCSLLDCRPCEWDLIAIENKMRKYKKKRKKNN